MQSGVTRYLEFKAISKLYIYSNSDKIVQVCREMSMCMMYYTCVGAMLSV